MININAINSIPQVKHAIQSLYTQMGDVNSVLESIVADNNSNFITFTIGDTEYQAEQEMTWEAWVNSTYNTTGEYSVTDTNTISKATIDSTATVTYADGIFVKADEFILDINYLLNVENFGGQ